MTATEAVAAAQAGAIRELAQRVAAAGPSCPAGAATR